MSQDLHTQITNKIIEQLEQGTAPWHQPWKFDKPMSMKLPMNLASGRIYQGINTPLLWMQQYPSEVFGTFQQWSERKEVIRKGEKGNLVIFFKPMEKTVEKDDGELDVEKFHMLRSYFVFNKSQLKSWKDEEQQPVEPGPILERIGHADEFVKNTGARVGENQAGRAYYDKAKDEIRLPPLSTLTGSPTQSPVENYYATELHELVHWTGHQSRLNRFMGQKFADKGYCEEELRAEMGTAFLCSSLDITDGSRPDHAQYIHHWLKLLSEDKKMLLSAASAATKSTEYLYKLQPEIV